MFLFVPKVKVMLSGDCESLVDQSDAGRDYASRPEQARYAHGLQLQLDCQHIAREDESIDVEHLNVRALRRSKPSAEGCDRVQAGLPDTHW